MAQLLGASSTTDSRVGRYGSIIQGAFLFGWALGGGFFGRIGDRLGRSRALCLTILTYAAFTGLSFFAQAWWHLMIFRFLAALGVGGEWAVGVRIRVYRPPQRRGGAEESAESGKIGFSALPQRLSVSAGEVTF